MSSAPQIRQGPENPAAQPPKPGDLVQIRQHLWLPENTVAKPPVQAGKSEAWIYAVVIEAGDTIRVRVQHPGNHQHREELTLAPADVRTAADVDTLAAKATTPELKKHFQVQADRLRKANAKSTPKGAAAK